MGWEDRDYNRTGGSGTRNPLMWILSGSVPLFTVFGIRVRMHASLILTIALVLLFGFGGFGFTWIDRVQSMTMLFVIVLLHEFGHCFAARSVGGTAEDILMTPLGGLAFAMAPRRPWPTFVTVAGGPLVNVLICALCWASLWLAYGWSPRNPLVFFSPSGSPTLFTIAGYVHWAYFMSYSLLLFNLLPIFPLDGGQLLQAILWPKLGYYKSMMLSCLIGMIGAGFFGMVSIAMFSPWMLLLWISCFLTCLNMRRQLAAAGPYEFQDEPDYSASLRNPDRPHRSKFGKHSLRKLRKHEQAMAVEQNKIDAILAKVSAHGMHTLTWWEKRTLRKATERQRRADRPRAGRA